MVARAAQGAKQPDLVQTACRSVDEQAGDSVLPFPSNVAVNDTTMEVPIGSHPAPSFQ